MPYDNTSQTLAEVRQMIKDGPLKGFNRARDLVSSIDRISEMLCRAPSDLLCNAPEVRKQIAEIHPAQHGISAKTLANLKSCLADALRLVGAIPPNDAKASRTLGWEAFLGHANAKHQAWSLSRLVSFCCNRMIEPDQVDDTVIEQFREYLDERLITKCPIILIKQMCQTWNGIVSRNDLPHSTLNYQQSERYICRPLSVYPKSLQGEINQLISRLGQSDLFDPDAPDKAMKPISLRNTEAHIRQYLDGLVNSGVKVSDCTGLASVITEPLMIRGFRAMLERTEDKKPTWSMNNIAGTLLAIARHHLKLPAEEIAAIASVRKRVSREPRGMSGKNKERLTQFNDWQNVVRLISLPSNLLDQARKSPKSTRSALLAMHAAQLAVLLSCPVRAKNLAALNLERDIFPSRNGSHTHYSIRIDGSSVKNEEPIEFRLNSRHSNILHAYITKFRPLISEAKGTALFPRRSDGLPRTPSQISQSLSGLIYRETGLHVHTHLFRHIAAKLYLSENPGDFETVRRLLKHRNLNTTMEFYAELSNQWAQKRYDEVVLSMWSGAND